MSNLETRLLTQQNFLENYKDLYEIDSHCMPFSWKLDQWRSLNLVPTNHTLYSVHNAMSEPIGFSLWSTADKDCAHLLKIAILPTAQSIGAGSLLMKENLRDLAKLSFSNFYLEVAAENFKAIKMYEKFGFKTICLKKKFYSDGMDACAMQLKLE